MPSDFQRRAVPSDFQRRAAHRRDSPRDVRVRPQLAPNQRPVTIEEVESILEKYGAITRDPADPIVKLLRGADGRALRLFIAALTHDSASAADNMQMMELIGDSLVNCVAIGEILRRRPEILRNPTGIVFRIMNDITSKEPLSDIALETGIGYLVRSRERAVVESVLEDSVEAFVGALLTLARFAPPELRPVILQRADNFTAAILKRTTEEKMARAASLQFNAAAYLSNAERASNLLNVSGGNAVQLSLKYTYNDSDGMYYPRVVEQAYDDEKHLGPPRTVLRAAPDSNLDVAKDNIHRLVIENSYMFNNSGSGAIHGAPSDFIEDPLSAEDKERLAFVVRLLDGKTPVPLTAETPGLAQSLRAAFTDARIDPTRANSSFYNMFGDRLLKMYLLAVYIPSRFPLRISSDSVDEINVYLSRISQARGAFAQRLGLMRFMKVSDRAVGANFMGLGKMMDYTFSSLLAVAVCHICNKFETGATGMIADTLSFMDRFLAPLLDSVDLSTTESSWHHNGRAYAYRIAPHIMPEKSRRFTQRQFGEDGETVTEASGLPTGKEGDEMRFYGYGVGRNAALDDMFDSFTAYVLNHPFRSTLDPGHNYPRLTGEFQLTAPRHA